MEQPPAGEPPPGDEDPTDGTPPGDEDPTDGTALPAAFERALAAVPAPVLAVDRAGTVLSANAAVEERLGYESAALVGREVGTCCPDLSGSVLAGHCGDDAGADSAAPAGSPERTDASILRSTGSASATPENGYLETRGVTADGEDVWLALDVAERTVGERTVYVGVIHDVTGYRTRERRLEQFERIVPTIDDGVYVLDDAFDIKAVNDAVEEITGYDRSELVGSNAAMLASEETLSRAAAVSETLVTGDGDAATISTTIETADGESLPIETRFSVYPFGDGSYGQVGVVRDISDRIWYEQTLTTLHDATRELLGAETPGAVGELVVEMVTGVIDLSAVVVYRFDSDVNVLRPAASAGAFPADPADLPPVSAGGADRGALRVAFSVGTYRVVVDESRRVIVSERGDSPFRSNEEFPGVLRGAAMPWQLVFDESRV